jgi:Flp pilus assembly protein TadG
MTNVRGQANKRSGTALVEFSLTAFLLVTTLLSVVEMTRFLLVYTTLANAARAGARYAIVHGGDRSGVGVNGPSGTGNISQVQTVVQNFASTGALNISNLTVNVTYPTDNQVGSTVIVQAIYPYDPFVGWFTPLSLNLQSSSRGVITY